MTIDSVSLNISTPSEPVAPGRGFYQLEEEALHIQVGPFVRSRRFFSYLDANGVRLDFDRSGRLIFIEVDVARRHWQTAPELRPPEVVEVADIRWLNFRDFLAEPMLLANERKTVLKVSFDSVNAELSYYLAQSVIAQTDTAHRLAALWITDIVDDLAGQEISAFRKYSRLNQSYYH